MSFRKPCHMPFLKFIPPFTFTRTTKRVRSNVVKDHFDRSRYFSVRWGNRKSVHGRPSWELAPHDYNSQKTESFAAWCKLVSKDCRFNDRAGECGVVRFTTHFFILDKAKTLPIRIGSQTA